MDLSVYIICEKTTTIHIWTKTLPTYCTCYNLKAFIMFRKKKKKKRVRDIETINVPVNSIRPALQWARWQHVFSTSHLLHPCFIVSLKSTIHKNMNCVTRFSKKVLIIIMIIIVLTRPRYFPRRCAQQNIKIYITIGACSAMAINIWVDGYAHIHIYILYRTSWSCQQLYD